MRKAAPVAAPAKMMRKQDKIIATRKVSLSHRRFHGGGGGRRYGRCLGKDVGALAWIAGIVGFGRGDARSSSEALSLASSHESFVDA